MTLTFPGSPLSGNPPQEVNYRIEGPKHRLLFHPHPRRVRALLGGEVVADTTAGALLHETGILPRFYIPEGDLNTELLEPTDHSTHCPFKGDASYWTVRAGGEVAENAIWTYREPLPEAEWLRGYASIYLEKMDSWLEEDEELRGHLRDPYHRIDVRESSRAVRVTHGDQVVAESERPITLFETGLSTRFYLSKDDLRDGVLEPSEKRTFCPYKGEATYWSVKVGGETLEDAAWSLEDPLEGAHAAAGRVCFLHDELEVKAEGETG